MNHQLLGGLALATFALPLDEPRQPTAPPPLVLLILIDDVGPAETSLMPELDNLRAGGTEFTRAYSHSWCAPTRDSLLFGTIRGLFRGDLCEGVNEDTHLAGDPSLMRALEDEGWSTWMIGKWHQGNAPRSGIGWEEGPLYWWQNWLAGTAYSSNGPSAQKCNDPALWAYPVPVGGGQVVNNGRITTDTRYDLEREWDAALFAISQALLSPEPDLVYVATQAAHSPWGEPPAFMMPPGHVYGTTHRERYEDEILALDWVIGQLVVAAGPDAWVIVAGDNGTPSRVDTDGLRGSKLEVYEGGVRVPMVVSGPGLAPGVVSKPVHVIDIAPTLLAEFGYDASWSEGSNLWGTREWVACWRGEKTRDRAIVEERYKLIRFDNGTEEMYDLLLDPGEAFPLALSGPDYDRLAVRMNALFP